MNAYDSPPTVPPFPLRHPTRPPLTLPRRLRSSSSLDWSEALGAPEAVFRDRDPILHHLEEMLAERERAVADAESRLAERARDLDEMEALLRAREALLASTRLRDTGSRGVVTQREAEALRQLQEELERQEATLRESRQALRDREKFLEESETRLFEKVQQQQEKESELEQREENLHAHDAGATGSAAPVPKPAYDEFRE